MINRAVYLACLIILTSITSELKAQWENPLVYYQFNQTSGTLVADSSSNSFDAIADCAGCWVAEGKYQGAIHFQGSQKIDLPAQDIALTNDSGTVAFWVLLPQSSAGTINTMWWAGEYGGDTFGPQNEMHINSEATENNIWDGGEIAFYVHDSLAASSYFLFSDPSKGFNPATPPSENAISLADNTWHHIACTWESESTIALYIDGQAIWDTTAYNPNPYDCNIMTIGAANERSNRKLTGSLDEFRIYDTALGAADIEAIYNYVPDGPTGMAARTVNPGKADLNFYPNPAAGKIFIMNTTGIETVEIYSPSGEKLIAQHVIGREGMIDIDISRLNSGIYFIMARNKDSLITTGKLSKE